MRLQSTEVSMEPSSLERDSLHAQVGLGQLCIPCPPALMDPGFLQIRMKLETTSKEIYVTLTKAGRILTRPTCTLGGSQKRTMPLIPVSFL